MRLRPLLLLVMFVLSIDVLATTLVAFSTDELHARASVVAVVELRDVRSRRAGGEISTFATASVSRAFKGAKAGDELTIVVPGGVDGDVVQKAFGAPAIADGETCVAFLEDAGGGYLQFVGLEQGHVEIRPDASSPGGWAVFRTNEATYVRPDGKGGLAPAAPLPASEPLGTFLDRLERLGRGR